MPLSCVEHGLRELNTYWQGNPVSDEREQGVRKMQFVHDCVRANLFVSVIAAKQGDQCIVREMIVKEGLQMAEVSPPSCQ
jgi:hypothetical protein